MAIKVVSLPPQPNVTVTRPQNNQTIKVIPLPAQPKISVQPLPKQPQIKVVPLPKFTQPINVVGALPKQEISLGQKVQRFLTPDSTIGRAIFNLPSAATQVAGSFARGGMSLGKTIFDTVRGGDLTSNDISVFRPKSRIGQGLSEALYGKSEVDIPSIGAYGQEIVGENFAKKNPNLTFGAGLILAGLDFTGAGGEKSAIKTLAKSKDVTVISKVLREIGVADDLVADYAPIIAKTGKEAEVSKIVSRIDDIQKTTSINPSRGISTESFRAGRKNLDLSAVPIRNGESKQLKILPELKPKNISYEQSLAGNSVTRQEVKQALSQFELSNPISGSKLTLPKPKVFPQIVDNADQLKDISGFKGQARDVYRNFKAVFGDKFQAVKKAVLDPFDASKGDYVAFQKSELDDLKKTIVDGLGIKKGSKESAAVQQYGEKLISYDDLVKQFGKDKAEKIVQADSWFRNKYDNLIEQVNSVRAKIYPNNPAKQVPKRADYYRHFQELTGFEGLKNIFENPALIDPRLSGISPFTKPRSKWASFMQRRLGNQTEFDAVGGFLNYLPSASYSIYIDPHIGQFRKLASELADQTTETRNVNNFIEFLQDFSNDLAGKTNPVDRYFQKVIPGGRKTMAAINWINSRVKANTILGNASSTIAQIFNVPQGIASAKQYSAKGMARTLAGIFTDNKPITKSAFINERYSSSLYSQFDSKLLEQPKKFAAWMTGVLDEAGTKFIWNAHFEKGLADGVENPIKYADDITRELVAGRGIGEVPLVQKSKLFQIVAPFQLEVGNLWYVLGDQVKRKDFAGLATFLAVNFLFNKAAEQVRGSDVSFDPVQSLIEGYQILEKEPNKLEGAIKATGRQLGEVLSNVPLGQTVASAYPEYGFDIPGIGNLTRKELFGEGDPTRFGSGLLATKGLKDPLYKVLPGFGGAQIKKTKEGLESYLRGNAEDKGGNKTFDIQKTPENLIKSSLFGQYATNDAKSYFDKRDNPTKEALKLKQLEADKDKQRNDLKKKIQPVYDEVQKLAQNGEMDKAQSLVDGLSDAEYEIYKSIKQSDKQKQAKELQPKMLKVYEQVQELARTGRINEAQDIVDRLTDEEYKQYQKIKELLEN